MNNVPATAVEVSVDVVREYLDPHPSRTADLPLHLALLREQEAGRGELWELVAQLRTELESDKGWDYTEYEKGRIAEKQRQISLLESALAQPGGSDNDNQQEGV